MHHQQRRHNHLSIDDPPVCSNSSYYSVASSHISGATTSSIMDLLNLIEKFLTSSLQKGEYDDCTFSSKKLNEFVERIISNYIQSRLGKDGNEETESMIHDINRILLPHGFNGVTFKDSFGVKDALDDIKLYKDEKLLFLHYEVTELQEDGNGWKLLATYSNLDAAFATRSTFLPEKHHITKVYFMKKGVISTEKSTEESTKSEKETAAALQKILMNNTSIDKTRSPVTLEAVYARLHQNDSVLKGRQIFPSFHSGTNLMSNLNNVNKTQWNFLYS